MKIGDARSLYYSNASQLTDNLRTLSKRKEAAEQKYRVTGEKIFSEEAATLELSIDATNKAYEENQKVLDSIIGQEASIANLETSKQQADAAEDMGKELGKVMTVFRRMIKGDEVPLTDEKKLMEFDDKMYAAAKNMQTMARQMEKEHEKHDSLWGDEEKKEYSDPQEVAENSEYTGMLPEIGIPEMPSAGAEE